MPTLEWIGKEKVINHHMDVPYRVLNRVYSYDLNGRHIEDNGSDNKIIHGDNLEALKSLLPEYAGRIKCIYIDIILQSLIQSRGKPQSVPLRCNLNEEKNGAKRSI